MTSSYALIIFVIAVLFGVGVLLMPGYLNKLEARREERMKREHELKRKREDEHYVGMSDTYMQPSHLDSDSSH
jgi:hypothetical protein